VIGKGAFALVSIKVDSVKNIDGFFTGWMEFQEPF
jgi:hypothetical protein